MPIYTLDQFTGISLDTHLDTHHIVQLLGLFSDSEVLEIIATCVAITVADVHCLILYLQINENNLTASFIDHVCGRNDPNYNQCIADNIIYLKDKFCYGTSPAGFPIIEPLMLDKIAIFDEPNVKLYVQNAEVYGTCDFVITSINVDPERLHFNFNYLMKRLVINTTYDFNIRLLVPVAHKGIILITTDNVEANIKLDLKTVTKNGKKHIYASKVTVNSKVRDFEYQFGNEKKLGQLNEIFGAFLDENKDIIINTVKPVLDRKFSEMYINMFNNITQSNYEEFFPENV
ncbi:Uncharacterized protein DBV15_01590 [Temnothorax longispinosus]|uniref:Circadian clock-controlled protein n=1 Tax=Temnothorax longispinosus TaxID=300112 RepID=A0A4S2KT87_9HYME|nr:Uncharacterized protein DBV15_01590 [Temnothorax longispinosus]